MKTYLEYNGQQFHQRAHPDAYELALEAMECVPPGEVLDVGAGAGYTSARLSDRGHRVRAVDINREQFVPTSIPFVKSDLNAALPFADASFDGVLALEIIEHLEAPRAFVRELGRVVRPGGAVVISTPNITSLRSKLRFLFAAEFTLFFDSERRTRDPFCAEASGHISPILPWLLDIFMRDAGLEPRARTWARAEFGIRSRHLAKTLVVRAERVKPP